MTWSEKILKFLSGLDIPQKLPKGIEVMNPYRDTEIFMYCKQFYHKYYNDTTPRQLIIGINPGRFGGGLTGIPFTDPVKLERECGIENTLPKRTELSADFIHLMIGEYGGPGQFYQKYYFTSVCPLGFTANGKNLNYYDVKSLQNLVEPFIIESIQSQLQFGADRSVAFCLGEGKNFKFLKSLNENHQFFKEVVPLSHPRFIMQYRRKKVESYIADYLEKFSRH